MDSYDKWRTTPPDEPDSNYHCDGCNEAFYPDDKVYNIEGLCLCEECAREWLEQQSEVATEEQCFYED